MTREDLRGIVEGISDEQLKKILDINSADIGKAKKGFDEVKAELETANEEGERMKTEILELREGQCEAEKMKSKIDELQKVIDDRRISDENLERQMAVEKRFNAAVGDAEFLNEYTKNGLLDKFSKALEAEENQGMSDKEIFGKLTGEETNLFVPVGGVPTVVASTSGFGGDLSLSDVREIMGLDRA